MTQFCQKCNEPVHTRTNKSGTKWVHAQGYLARSGGRPHKPVLEEESPDGDEQH